MSVAPGSVTAVLPPHLSFYGGKAQIRHTINKALSDLLAIKNPCLEAAILPTHYNGHFLTHPRLNVGGSNMRGFPAWFQWCPQDRHPDCTRPRFPGPTEICSLPTKKFGTLSSTSTSRTMASDDLSVSPPLPSVLLPTVLQARVAADDETDMIPGLNYRYKTPAIAPAPAVAPHYSPDGSIISISLTSTAKISDLRNDRNQQSGHLRNYAVEIRIGDKSIAVYTLFGAQGGPGWLKELSCTLVETDVREVAYKTTLGLYSFRIFVDHVYSVQRTGNVVFTGPRTVTSVGNSHLKRPCIEEIAKTGAPKKKAKINILKGNKENMDLAVGRVIRSQAKKMV
ncbi:hypothetical protein B0H14DRAFT_2650422 [Mycena olivaceomarginata]|nr:hypothetical protein B0H14DRAFT_2650422 [Mycena olivaceomarginata]